MSWNTVKLSEVATIERTSVAPEAIMTGTTYVGLEHIASGGESLSPVQVAAGELSSNKFTFDADTILFGKLRPYLAKIVAPSFAGVCSTDILPIRPLNNLDKKFLLHFLLDPRQVAHATNRATGANLPRLSPRELASIEIPLPPLDEQRRIAGILDAADALRRRRREALALLDTLPGAIFAEMFGSLTTSDRYQRGPLSKLIDDFSTGKNLAPASDEVGTRHRVLKVSAVTRGEFIEAESKPLPAEYSPPEAHFVRSGDLLFSRANTSALIGATALVEAVSENIVLPDKIWEFKLDDRKANPTFLHHLFATRKFRDQVSRRASGSSGSMKNISKGKVLSIEVAQPTIEEQNEFARRVRIGRSIRTQTSTQLAKLETLFASLQYCAFAGKL